MRISDWSSDVCSSDLGQIDELQAVTDPAQQKQIVQKACRQGPDENSAHQQPLTGPARQRAFGGKIGFSKQTGIGQPIDPERKSVEEGKSVSVRVGLGGRRSSKKKKVNATQKK